ncbi:MAG: hypothetical protein BMS9Abin26_0015 [Gammaproteobacteria bacterium]|nr:MAG: hypothetical protein BMS9Abin26_0015 [Gammaproteobacteria bacterium]
MNTVNELYTDELYGHLQRIETAIKGLRTPNNKSNSVKLCLLLNLRNDYRKLLMAYAIEGHRQQA